MSPCIDLTICSIKIDYKFQLLDLKYQNACVCKYIHIYLIQFSNPSLLQQLIAVIKINTCLPNNVTRCICTLDRR